MKNTHFYYRIPTIPRVFYTLKEARRFVLSSLKADNFDATRIRGLSGSFRCIERRRDDDESYVRDYPLFTY